MRELKELSFINHFQPRSEADKKQVRQQCESHKKERKEKGNVLHTLLFDECTPFWH